MTRPSCAAALANLRLMRERDTLRGVRERASLLAELLAPLQDHPHVGEVRQRGLMVGIELVADRASRRPYEARERVAWRVSERARHEGIFIRPLGDVVVLMPALAIPPEPLRRLAEVVSRAIDEVTMP